MEHLALRRELSRLRAAGLGALEGIVGKTRAICKTNALIERVAGSDATVITIEDQYDESRGCTLGLLTPAVAR